MKKKVLALMSAMVLTFACSMTAYADSPTVGTVQQAVATQTATTTVEPTNTAAGYAATTAVSAGFEVEAASDTTVAAALVAVQNQVLNDIATVGALLGRSDIAAAATDADAKVTATVLTTVDVDVTTATKEADGLYHFTLGVPGIQVGDAILVQHYNGVAWENLVPTQVGAGAVNVASASCSPFTVVKLSATTVKQSPKTGETAPVAALVILAGAAGAVFCSRKALAK